MADYIERPTKRQRTCTNPFVQPTRTQPSRLVKQSTPALEPEPKPKPKLKLILRVSDEKTEREQEHTSEPAPVIESEYQEPDTSPGNSYKSRKLVLRHIVHAPWKTLPFAKPEQVHLKIAINAHETENDIVQYAPESATNNFLVPWKRGTDVLLYIPHEAVIVTTTDASSGDKKHLMLFGEDMEDAMYHEETYNAMKILVPEVFPNWYPTLVRLWGGALDGKISIQNIFTKVQEEFHIWSVLDLEAHRMRILVEHIKLDFMRKTGLSVHEVQDIFKKRTEITSVLTHCRNGVIRTFQLDLHVAWERSLGVSTRVRQVQRPVACALSHGAEILQRQLEGLSLHGLDPTEWYTRLCKSTAVVVVDVGYHHAGATTVLLTAKGGYWTSTLPTVPVSINNGRIDLHQPVREMLEREYGCPILVAATQSNKSYESVLDNLINDFVLCFNSPNIGVDMKLVYRDGVSLTLGEGDEAITITELHLTYDSVVATVRKWLEPIIELVEGEIAGLNNYRIRWPPSRTAVHRRILMTGYWTWSPCIIKAFKEGLSASLCEGVEVEVQGTHLDNSVAVAKGAFWSMTADDDNDWLMNKEA